jgi:hypothetical protein
MATRLTYLVLAFTPRACRRGRKNYPARGGWFRRANARTQPRLASRESAISSPEPGSIHGGFILP